MSNAPTVAAGFVGGLGVEAPGAAGPLVFGIRFSALDAAGLVAALAGPVAPGSGVRLVATANLDHVVQLRRNARFRRAYAGAFAATADGAPVALYARLRGVRIPGRVAGVDLFERLMAALRPGVHRPFFLVGHEATGAGLRAWLEARGFAAEAIATFCPPFGFERDEAGSARLAAAIRAHGTTHLVLGVGAPKSEIWVDSWRGELGDCCALAVGAGLDFFLGRLSRAPLWMQRLGLEWLWRLGLEPRRLWRRYAVDAWSFPLAVVADLSGGWPGTGRDGLDRDGLDRDGLDRDGAGR